MLQSTDPKRLGNKEGLSGEARISLGRRKRIDFAHGLGEGGVGNRRAQVLGEGRRKHWEKLMELGHFRGSVES